MLRGSVTRLLTLPTVMHSTATLKCITHLLHIPAIRSRSSTNISIPTSYHQALWDKLDLRVTLLVAIKTLELVLV